MEAQQMLPAIRQLLKGYLVLADELLATATLLASGIYPILDDSGS